MFTDCLFFIDGRECTSKTGQCLFRHCQKSRETKSVCVKWLGRQCEDTECPNRHPRLTRNGSMINESGYNRCPSHNAFKCFGECGKKDCNTHFLEQSAYFEHVRLGIEKPLHPLAKCPKCQAVFFSGPERLNHRCLKNINEPPGGLQCFTSTHVQAEKDIAHPTASYPTASYPTASYPTKSLHGSAPYFQPSKEAGAWVNTSVVHALNGAKTDFSTAYRTQPSTDTVLQNIDLRTSSSFNGSHEAIGISHRPAQTTCTTVGSKAPVRKDPEPIGVFWDFENCSIPKGKSALAIVRKLRSVFFVERREVEFMCVCDISKEKKAVIEQLNKAQVTVVHINSTSKNAADDKLRQSLRRFAQTYCAPATVILISGDGNFAVELSDLRHRHKFHIICLHNAAASSALLGFAHETHRFDLFAEDLETFTVIQVSPNPLLSTDVLITNLPSSKTATLLKGRLTKLSDNCGGKVLSVSGTKAMIRFSNPEAAFRARRRLDKEELFGSILQATLLPPKNDKNPVAARRSENSKEPEGRATTNRPPTTANVIPGPSTSPSLNAKPKEENKKPVHSGTISSNLGRENARQTAISPLGGLAYFARSPILNHHFPTYPGNTAYNNVFRAPAVHSMFQLPPRTAPPSLRGVNPGILPPVGPLSPIVNGVVRRSPSPEQQFSGVDLLVTNINENSSKKEVKKKLASVFREHCKVYSVVLHARNGAPLRAFIKVPKITDAHLAISKVNGKTVLGKIVHVSIASEKDKELCYLQDEVVVVLQDAALNWLPLATFLANFEKKYRRSLDARHLDQIRDVAVVNGSAGCQTISLLDGKIDTELVEVDAASFPCDVYKLLHHYDGVMPLASFPALYWLEFHKEVQLSSSGTLLAEVLSGLPNVKVESSLSVPSRRCIQWIKPTSIPCDASSLRRLSEELVEILQKDHEFEMSIGQLKDRYLSTFNKPLDASTRGFETLNDLLHALPAVLEISVTDGGICASLTRQHRVTLFGKETEELLTKHMDNTALLSNFMASYVKHFGQKFKVASFGYSRLTDLIKAIPEVAEIDGIGDQRTVTLVHKKEEARTLQCLLDNLTKELTDLLNAAAGHEIRLNDVMKIYREQHDRELSLPSYGCETLEELLKLLSNHFQVVPKDDETFLQFYTKLTVDKVKEDLTFLVQNQESRFIYVRTIPQAYEKMFHRTLLCDLPQLREILQSMNKELQIHGGGNDQIVGFGSNVETSGVDLEFLLAKAAMEILYGHPDYALPKLKFLSLYRQKLQELESVAPERKLLDCLPCCVVLRKQGKEEIASLKQDYRVQILIEQLKELLSSSPDMSAALTDIPILYQKHFGVKLNLNLFGVNDIVDMKERLQGFIEITVDCEVNRVVLSPISRFQVETKSLLDSCGGCISLNRFAPVYQQLFSKACIVADFGYCKLASLLNAVPHVARVIGNGAEKVVIAVEMNIPERVCTDLLSVRIINEECDEVTACLSNEGKVASTEDLNQHPLTAKPLENNVRVGNDTLVNCYSKKNGLSNDRASPVAIGNEQTIGELHKDEQKVCPTGQNCTPHKPSSSKAVSHSGILDQKQSKVKQTEQKDAVIPPERSARSYTTSSPRSTSQKVRLAANFNFSRDT